MEIKDGLRNLIAGRHGGFISRRIARMCEQYLNAYNNVANWDMSHNGELRALRQVLAAQPGDVIDAGANNGQWALTVLPFTTGHPVHSFEPVPQIFEVLQRELAGKTGVRTVNAGLGSREETITINYSPDVSTISSAFPLIYDAFAASPVECRILTGDGYVAEQGIERIALLKIDVEGMEAECLAGFDKSFQDGKVAAVQFEHGPSHIHSGHTFKYFRDWFDARGFDLFAVFPKRLIRLEYDILRESFAGRNYFAIRRILPDRWPDSL